ncbi:L,D-transpeptidase [Brumimicrobium glaciale]|uniref:L,D-transpeptidase n=1 Tax=Brumimicrobium glaciale TaxID=200475 RepID=UPI0013EBB522|nr:L,D-transpeptidase [Brumimicrobium glaciale]
MSLFILIQCTSESPKAIHLLEKKKLETQSDTTAVKIPLLPQVNYHLISTKDSNDWLMSLPPGDTLQALLVLNRIDRKSLLKLDTLVFPDTVGVGIALYSPFPKNVAELSTIHKILFISYYAQAFAVYENGSRIKWGPASLGKQATPTPTGLFSTNWKSKRTISTVNKSWVMDWYFNIANFQGVSMHQYALPGYPASHACIRLYNEDAYWLYNWADEWILDQSNILVYGTPVVIFGKYPFDQRKPWLLQSENNIALTITTSELIAVTQEFLPAIMERQAKRDSVEFHL